MTTQEYLNLQKILNSPKTDVSCISVADLMDIKVAVNKAIRDAALKDFTSYCLNTSWSCDECWTVTYRDKTIVIDDSYTNHRALVSALLEITEDSQNDNSKT